MLIEAFSEAKDPSAPDTNEDRFVIPTAHRSADRPDAVHDLLMARRFSGDDVVGMPSEFVYLHANDHRDGLTVRRKHPSEIFARFVAGGTLLLDRGLLRSLGDFRRVRKFVDAQLLSGVEAAGERHGLAHRQLARPDRAGRCLGGGHAGAPRAGRVEGARAEGHDRDRDGEGEHHEGADRAPRHGSDREEAGDPAGRSPGERSCGRPRAANERPFRSG